MNKKEQIEELARDIEKSLERAKSVVGSMNKGIGYWIAEDLVNKNYRKVIPNVDFVVRAGELPTIQEQIEEIRTNIWHENTTLSEVCDYIIRKQQEVREQTAKEIITYLRQFEGYANIAAEELVKKYSIEEIGE